MCDASHSLTDIQNAKLVVQGDVAEWMGECGASSHPSESEEDELVRPPATYSTYIWRRG